MHAKHSIATWISTIPLPNARVFGNQRLQIKRTKPVPILLICHRHMSSTFVNFKFAHAMFNVRCSMFNAQMSEIQKAWSVNKPFIDDSYFILLHVAIDQQRSRLFFSTNVSFYCAGARDSDRKRVSKRPVWYHVSHIWSFQMVYNSNAMHAGGTVLGVSTSDRIMYYIFMHFFRPHASHSVLHRRVVCYVYIVQYDFVYVCYVLYPKANGCTVLFCFFVVIIYMRLVYDRGMLLFSFGHLRMHRF